MLRLSLTEAPFDSVGRLLHVRRFWLDPGCASLRYRLFILDAYEDFLKTLYWLLTTFAAIVLVGFLASRHHVDPLQFRNSIPAQNETPELWIIVHRVNTPARAREIQRIAMTNSELTLHGRPVRWGAEMDLRYRGGKLIVSHSWFGSGATSLTAIASQLPDQSMLVIELKSSVLADEAIDAVRKSVPELPQTVVYSSFDHRILTKLRAEPDTRTAIMTWQMSRSGGSYYRVMEYVTRMFGTFGGFLPDQLDISIAAYPCYQASADLVATLRKNGVATICGTVDSERALSAIAHIPVIGLFTDHPELIADYARRHP